MTCWSTSFHHFMNDHAADWWTSSSVLVRNHTLPPIWALPAPVTPNTFPAPKSREVRSTGSGLDARDVGVAPRNALIEVAEVEVSIVIEPFCAAMAR